MYKNNLFLCEYPYILHLYNYFICELKPSNLNFLYLLQIKCNMLFLLSSDIPVKHSNKKVLSITLILFLFYFNQG